jgi:hypothetical protein
VEVYIEEEAEVVWGFCFILRDESVMAQVPPHPHLLQTQACIPLVLPPFDFIQGLRLKYVR